MLIAAVFLTLSLLMQAAPTQDASPHTEHFANVNGIRVHYLDWGGEGEPLVLLTGYGAAAHTFDHFARRLTDRFRVVSFTRRGTAPSERPAAGYDLMTLTADVGVFLDVLGFKRVHLVGHSFAGTEMTEFATLYPERVASLVYIDAALDSAAGFALMKDSGARLPQPQPGSPFSQVMAWQRRYTPDFSALKSPALAFYTTRSPVPVPKDATEDIRRKFDEFARTKWMPLVDRMANKFRTETNTGRAIVFEDSSHYIFRDREDDVVREMQSFYASLEP